MDKDLYSKISNSIPGLCFIIYDKSFRITFTVGDSLASSLWPLEKELIGKNIRDLDVINSDCGLYNHLLSSLSGETVDSEVESLSHIFRLRFSPLRSKDDQIESGMVIIHDITDLAKTRNTLRSQSIRDELTGLYNRRGFFLLADQQIKMANRNNSGLLLFFIDLNNLKIINDSIGHQAGDQYLRESAKILTSVFRDSDIISRYGGDEFVVLVGDSSPNFESVIRDRIHEASSTISMKCDGRYISFSIGCSYFDPNQPKSIEELVCEADQKMYMAKRDSRKSNTSKRL